MAKVVGLEGESNRTATSSCLDENRPAAGRSAVRVMTLCKVCALLFLWTASLIACLLQAGLIPSVRERNKTLETRILKESVYRAHGKPILLVQDTPKVIDEMDLRLEFSVAALKQWMNAFQTAPYNQGVRLEFYQAPVNGGSVAASLVVRNAVLDSTAAFSIGDDLKLNRKYYLRLRMRHTKTGFPFLDVFLDEAFMGTITGIKPYMSSFVLGYGFDKDRQFSGNVVLKELSFSLGSSAAASKPASMFLLACFLLIVVLTSVCLIQSVWDTNFLARPRAKT